MSLLPIPAIIAIAFLVLVFVFTLGFMFGANLTFIKYLKTHYEMDQLNTRIISELCEVSEQNKEGS